MIARALAVPFADRTTRQKRVVYAAFQPDGSVVFYTPGGAMFPDISWSDPGVYNEGHFTRAPNRSDIVLRLGSARVDPTDKVSRAVDFIVQLQQLAGPPSEAFGRMESLLAELVRRGSHTGDAAGVERVVELLQERLARLDIERDALEDGAVAAGRDVDHALG